MLTYFTLDIVTAQPTLNLTQLQVDVTWLLVSKCPHTTHPPMETFHQLLGNLVQQNLVYKLNLLITVGE